MIKKITFLYLITISILLSTFIWTMKSFEKKNKKIIIHTYENIIKSGNFKSLETVNLDSINAKIIKHNRNYIIFEKKGLYYLKNNNKVYFLKFQEILKNEIKVLYLVFFVIIFLITLLFVIIFNIFKPLKLLSKKMSKISSGNFNLKEINLKADKEIQVLIDKFNIMSKKINEFIVDRENFIKYIGHELKTPLAKIKFAIENNNLESIKKNTIILDKLINEFVFINLITKENLKHKKFLASTLIAESLSLIEVEENDINIELEDFYIEGDLYYLAIAIRNLIENGLKYTTKKPINIIIKPNMIKICSFGKKIDKNFNEIKKMFVKKSDGFGIGLSIVDKIISLHNFEFKYSYENYQNCFIIDIISQKGS